jgi:hypothetical protein
VSLFVEVSRVCACPLQSHSAYFRVHMWCFLCPFINDWLSYTLWLWESGDKKVCSSQTFSWHLWHINQNYLSSQLWYRVTQGLLYRWTEHSADFVLKEWPLGEGKRPPKLHPRGGFFGPWSFTILKHSHQGLSNEGSNFILSSLEVGHWAAQTQPFFDNFPEITDFGLLQQSQNRAKFWIC